MGVDTSSNASAISAPQARWIAQGALLALLVSTSLQALPTFEPDVARRLAEVDCSRVTAADVGSTLAHTPAPRVIAIQGSVPIVTMEPFVAFLEAMGYPGAQLQQPASATRSYSSFVDSRRLAGHLAWHYEQDGLMPMLIGHSQGGMIVIKVLHDLAGVQEARLIFERDELRREMVHSPDGSPLEKQVFQRRQIILSPTENEGSSGPTPFEDEQRHLMQTRLQKFVDYTYY